MGCSGYDANLLIIGAPKSGTTTVHDVLIQSPDVITHGQEKELFFLMDDGHPLKKKRYTKKNGEAKYRIDSTVHYLYQESALHYCNVNNVKSVAILRNPVRRLYSAFNFMKYSHSAVLPEYDFDHFVSDLLVGNEESIMKSINNYHAATAMAELANGCYDRYLDGWLALGEKFKVFLFDELAGDEQALVASISDWLGINFEYEALESNKTYVPKSVAVNALVKALSRMIPFLRRFRVLRQVYGVVNVDRQVSIPKLSSFARSKLEEYYLPSVKRLSAMVGDDLALKWEFEVGV